MSLTQLIYMSSMRQCDDATIESIAHSAHRRNLDNGVTGMLLYCDGNVLQVLEGEDSAVSETFERIQKDPRHHSIFLILQAPIHERECAAWSMGLHIASRNGQTAPSEDGSIFKLKLNALCARVKPGPARTMLVTFIEDLRAT